MLPLSITIVLSCLAVAAGAGVSPVILVPGDAGSQLEGKWDKQKVPKFYCAKNQTTWTTLWVSVTKLLPGAIDCFSDNIRLVFDAATGTYSNSPGVTVRAPGFGTTDNIEYIAPQLKSQSKYYFDMVEFLTTLGLKRNEGVRGAPYDFRYSVNSNQGWLNNMTTLVEETYKDNNNTKVTLVTHSLGCLYTLAFLQQKPQEWKDLFIHAFVPISAPWRGTVSQLRLFASGYADLIPGGIVKPLTVRAEQRSWESNIYLLPIAGEDTDNHTWTKDEELVSTEKSNYSAHDMQQFFVDMGYPIGYEMYQAGGPSRPKMEYPGVTTHCLYGVNLPTEIGYRYLPGDFPDTEPNKRMGLGDGTVNDRSLTACQDWATTTDSFEKIGHTEMLSDENVFARIKQIVQL